MAAWDNFFAPACHGPDTHQVHACVSVLLSHAMKKTDLVEGILQPLRGPVLQAHRQTRKLLERDDLSQEVRQGLLMIRSMCARAENVFSGAHLLQALNSLNLEIRLARTNVGHLFTLLDDAVDDMTALLDPERQLKITVHEEEFHPSSSRRLK